MKQTKKPTRSQKILIAKNNLKPENWRVISENKTELIIINAKGNKRILKKGV